MRICSLNNPKIQKIFAVHAFHFISMEEFLLKLNCKLPETLKIIYKSMRYMPYAIDEWKRDRMLNTYINCIVEQLLLFYMSTTIFQQYKNIALAVGCWLCRTGNEINIFMHGHSFWIYIFFILFFYVHIPRCVWFNFRILCFCYFLFVILFHQYFRLTFFCPLLILSSIHSIWLK